ncbi:MAG: hypothetical protein BWX84_01817 [Verrucomicrobia bacterium ADurb.Bin118]|nr:MAG: hypothetical protein BWX84_01817 [Verrucomicrobia bacterium ADurb.Bin118]
MGATKIAPRDPFLSTEHVSLSLALASPAPEG